MAAIFSPAKITEENKILRTKPQAMPINNSWNIIGTKFAPIKNSIGGNSNWPTKPIPRAIAKTIRTVSGIMREPKKGEATRKAPILNEEIIKSIR